MPETPPPTAVGVPARDRGRDPPPRAGQADPRVSAFCATERPEVFHAVAYRNDIWKDDPFDVETIHEEARDTFRRLVDRAAGSAGSGSGVSGGSGRILLLQGEAGSGKTHLLRAFRNWTHARGRGYFGYLQMTSATGHYGRYVLNNLIDSLDQPYFEPAGETSGLLRISTALADSARGVPIERLDEIRGGEHDLRCLVKLIEALADQVVMDERFDAIDLDLIRALLLLQSHDPRIKGRVLKYLRCEDLAPQDRAFLGGIVPRTYDDAPQWLIQRFGELMAALESVPLVLGVDQLEDIYNLDDAEGRFRRALAMLCDLVSRTPNAVVVIACLENFYDLLKGKLTRPLVDRIEKDPAPLWLKGTRDEDEVVRIVARRLRVLYESHGTSSREDDPTFPMPRAYLKRLAGLRTRDVLQRCQEYRERCVAAGRLVATECADPVAVEPVETAVPGPRVRDATAPLEHAWNDFRNTSAADVPAVDEKLAAVLSGAVRACSDESETGQRFEVETDGRFVLVECHVPGQTLSRLLVGVCNADPRGGWLGRQIAEVVERAGAGAGAGASTLTPVIVRSTEFPSNPRTAVARQVEMLVAGGGRRVVVEDSDWRVMLALPRFRDRHRDDPALGAWLKRARPLSLLKSLRTILDRDRPRPSPPRVEPPPDVADTTAG